MKIDKAAVAMAVVVTVLGLATYDFVARPLFAWVNTNVRSLLGIA